MRRAAIRTAAIRTIAARGGQGSAAVDRSLRAINTVSSGTSEARRLRRDPSSAAARRRGYAVRRVEVWGAGTAAGVIGTAVAALHLVAGVSATSVFYVVLALLVLGYCGLGLFRSGKDLRVRTRVVAALPPPQPARSVPPLSVKPELETLGNYSDSLRSLMGAVGLVEDRMLAELRRDVFAAADHAETGLRRMAAHLASVERALRGGSAQARADLADTRTQLIGRIRTGVHAYSELVGASAQAANSSAALQPAFDGVHEQTVRLRGLAEGLRALAVDPPEPPR